MNKRLVKELLVYSAKLLAENENGFDKSISNYSFYFTEATEVDDALAGARAIDSLDFIPWPDERCLVMAMSPEGNKKSVLSGLVRDVNADPQVFDIAVFLDNGQVHHRSGVKALRRYSENLGRIAEINKPDVFRKTLSKKGGWAPNEYSEEADLPILRQIREHWTGWYAFPPDLDINSELSDTDVCAARINGGGVAYGLSPLAVPTGYFVKTYLGPFGNSVTRKLFSIRPIIQVINFDRLYGMSVSEHADEPREVAPHHRRGHIRHLWKSSGVNKLSLPPSPGERLRMAQEKKVRRVYVSQAWIGNREFVYDGMKHEIELSDRELRL
jgi:hypothetical protein